MELPLSFLHQHFNLYFKPSQVGLFIYFFMELNQVALNRPDC